MPITPEKQYTFIEENPFKKNDSSPEQEFVKLPKTLQYGNAVQTNEVNFLLVPKDPKIEDDPSLPEQTPTYVPNTETDIYQYTQPNQPTIRATNTWPMLPDHGANSYAPPPRTELPPIRLEPRGMERPVPSSHATEISQVRHSSTLPTGPDMYGQPQLRQSGQDNTVVFYRRKLVKTGGLTIEEAIAATIDLNHQPLSIAPNTIDQQSQPDISESTKPAPNPDKTPTLRNILNPKDTR